jgi:hypothetical protein
MTYIAAILTLKTLTLASWTQKPPILSPVGDSNFVLFGRFAKGASKVSENNQNILFFHLTFVKASVSLLNPLYLKNIQNINI